MSNRQKTPSLWKPDTERSVADYNAWYLREAPLMWVQARGRAVVEVADAMNATKDFTDLSPAALRAHPGALFVARMAVSPTMARDRFVGFSGANKSLVLTMERGGALGSRSSTVQNELTKMCDFLRPLLDPGLFPWLAAGRAPTSDERDKALLVVGERLAGAFYLPDLRNAQETRQKQALREFLDNLGFMESTSTAFEMPPGTYGFGRNVPVIRADGANQNLPVDCVVAPFDDDLPLACIELKSAGDFANVNKRRKEESDKHEALRRAHGDAVVFLLQLFGYFGPPYLGFEASAGIDWAWDHRLEDFKPHLGI